MSMRISAVDHALCQAAAKAIRRGRPYVAGRMPLTITPEQAAERRDFGCSTPWPSAISSATTATITTCSSWRGGGRRRARARADER